jgi:hypothetical protein
MHSDRHPKPSAPITESRVRLRRWNNPLARPADKYLPVASALMLFLWIVLIPFVAAQASVAAANAERGAAAEAEQLTTVEATLLRATQARYDSHGLILATEVPVQARWASSTGAIGQGEISAAPGLAAGTKVTVWLTSDGTAHGPPRTPSAAGTHAVLVSVEAWLGCGLALLVCNWALSRAAWRRNIRRWAAEWAELGLR